MAAVGFVQSDVACHVVRSFGREARRSLGRSRVVPTLLRALGDEATPERTTFGSGEPSSLRTWTRRCSTKSPPNSRPRRSGSRQERLSTPPSLPPRAKATTRRAGSTQRPGAVYGFKAHVGADADTALVEEIAITPANVNDGKAGPQALPDEPGEVFADSAYRGKTFREAVQAKGGCLRVAATGMWGRDEAETLARLEAWNRPIHRIRGRIEKIFGTWKRSYGLRRMRWRGLAKAGLQIRFTAVAYNIKRCSRILAAA